MQTEDHQQTQNPPQTFSEILQKYIESDSEISETLSLLGFSPEQGILIIYEELQSRSYGLPEFYSNTDEIIKFIIERCNLENIPKFKNHIKVIGRIFSDNDIRREKLIDICIDHRCLPSNSYISKGDEVAFKTFMKQYKANKHNHTCFKCYQTLPPEPLPKLTRQNADQPTSGYGFFEYKCKHCMKEEIRYEVY